MTLFLQLLVTGVTTGAVYALVALGYTLIFNVSRVLNLAQGAFLTFGALLTYTLLTEYAFPPWAAAALGVAVAGLIGIAIDRIGLARAYRGSLSSLLVITIGLSMLLEGVAQFIWGTTPVRLPAMFGTTPLNFGGVAVASQSLVIIAVLAVAAPVTALFFGRTHLGKTMRAVADNRLAAAMIGINVARTSTLAFGLAGLIGGLAGILLAPLTFASYDSGTFVGLKGLVGAVIGGLHNPLGALAGGLLIGVVETLGIGYVSSLFNHTTTFLALVLVLVIRSCLRAPHLEAARAPRARYLSGVGRRGSRIGLAAAAAALAVLPLALPNHYLVGLATLIGVFAIAVVGLDLLKGFAGILSLGQAAFMGIAAYGSAILTMSHGWDPFLALVVMAMGGAVVALLLGLSSVRLEGYNMALATLGFSIIVQDLVTGMRDLTGGASGLSGIGSFALGPIPIQGSVPMYYLVWGVAIGACVLVRTLRASQAGRALEAIGQHEAAAASLGIPVKRYKIAAFVIASVFASVAGSLYVHLNSFVAPSLAGMSTSIALLTMLIVGGEGYVWGGILGAAIITLIPQVFGFLEGRELIVQGLILVLAMQFMPDGLWGAGARLIDRLKPAGRPRAVDRGREP